MKKRLKNRVFTSILAICLLVAAIPGVVLAANEIYVNEGGAVLDNGLSGAYAVGGDGTVAQLPGASAYALTGEGMQEIGGGVVTPTPSPGVGPDGTVVTPAALSGTVNVQTDTIRIGLYYYYSSSRNTSQAIVGLSAVNGNGYRFGYYDANRNFVALGSTSETALTVVKDTNITTSGGTIGCYHIKLNGTYSSFSAASTAASAFSDGFPAYYNGSFYVLVGQYQSQADAEAALVSRGISGTAFSASNRCVVVTKTGTTKILFEYDCGTDSSLAIEPTAVSGKPTTKLGSNTFYGGFQFIRTKGENMTVVNFLNIEDYVKGVVPYEMSASWPLEALKAQACCARTYALRNLNMYNSYGFDLTNDTYCQAYLGTGRANDNSNCAVDETAGQYITYNGSLISALYSSSCGGGTESNANVNGNNYHPYLAGVIDPFEAASDSINSYSSWTVTMTPERLGGKVGLAAIVEAVPTYSPTNNCIRIDFLDVKGNRNTIQRDACRTRLGLNSIHYTISKDAGGNYVFTGGGWGHNVGMSQFGAYAMAKTYGFSYAHIIGFYFTGVKLSTGV